MSDVLINSKEPLRVRATPPNGYNSFKWIASFAFSAGRPMQKVRDTKGRITEFETQAEALAAARSQRQ